MTTPAEQKAAARQFAEFWRGKGYEKGQTQPFWLDLLKILGVADPERGYIEFEDKAHIDAAHGFIDGYIPATRVLVEQKSIGKNLRAGIAQSDGSVLTPYQQAKRYIVDLPLSRHPRWVVTCNFESFLVYDMERPNAEPETILLGNLPDELYRLSFLVQTEADFIRREEEISKAAGDVVGKIYDALLRQYRDPSNPASLKSLNELCVRLVFLFYAEDAGVFRHLQFRDYIRRFPARDARRALIDLFKVLDTRPEDRDPYLEPDLAAFPYVNGGLFANENLEIPQFTDEILALVVKNGSEEFDWKDISPTIFGAVFESTLNPETRRSGGMHYTSLANIHKVIGPLFLDALSRRVDEALRTTEHTENTEKKGSVSSVSSVVKNKLRALQDEMASLTFLDPACGSGNFLTETYVCLRRLENRIIAALQGGQGQFDLEGDTVKVSIRQFHGIEINDFAVAVAKSALWIAESQMLNETQALLHRNIDFLPLKTYDGIVEGNALRMDWASLAPRFDYIMGNPPFVGKKEQSTQQKAELVATFGNAKGVGNLDYVCGWYAKAAELLSTGNSRAAFVSTNSISQGEQVCVLWSFLFAKGIHIDFAYQTFRWDSESNSKAAVHCVIIGFSKQISTDKKQLFDSAGNLRRVNGINPYLTSGPDVLVSARTKSLNALHPISYGSMPIDGNHLVLEIDEHAELLAENPNNALFAKRYAGGEEIIKGTERWCLWLKDVSPALFSKSSFVRERIRLTKEFREKSGRPQTRALADTPYLFGEIRQPTTNMLVLPKVSSEGRRYIPLSFVSPDIIISGSALIVPEATLFEFGILSSNVHNAWMRAVGGRLEMRYQYSGNIVYNNFPWPSPTEEQKSRIEETAQGILAARDAHPDCSLKILYDELTMPPDLRKAHQENDRAVMAAYGFPVKMTESECVAELFKRYQALVSASLKPSAPRGEAVT